MSVAIWNRFAAGEEGRFFNRERIWNEWLGFDLGFRANRSDIYDKRHLIEEWHHSWREFGKNNSEPMRADAEAFAAERKEELEKQRRLSEN